MVIEEEISPEYILREKRSTIKNNLTIATTIAAIAPRIIPYPIGSFVSWISLIFAIVPLYNLIIFSLPGNIETRKIIVQKIAAISCLLISLLALVLSILFSIQYHLIDYEDLQLFFRIGSLIYLMFFLLTFFYFRKIVKKFIGSLTFSNILKFIKTIFKQT